MIVSRQTFQQVVKDLLGCSSPLSFDTETYGVRYVDGLFAISVATGNGSYYFNFNKEKDHKGNTAPESHILDTDLIKDLGVVFLTNKRCYAHNAKFDIHRLMHMGLPIEVFCNVYDTMALATIWNNAYTSYSLDNLCARFFDEQKIDIKEYLDIHKLHTITKNEITGRTDKQLHYDLVPYEIMAEYAEKDAVLTLRLGEYLHALLEDYDSEQKSDFPSRPSVLNVVELEKQFTPVLTQMERTGVQLDVKYCRKAMDNCEKSIKEWETKFSDLSNSVYDNKKKTNEAAILKSGGEIRVNVDSGQSILNKKELTGMVNPVADCINNIRKFTAEKVLYSNYLKYADNKGILHTNYNAKRDKFGAKTGRLTSAEPNLQNMKRDSDDTAYQPRRCIIPRKGFFLCMIDYDQQEYKMMLDYANEAKLIAEVLAGKDVHQAIADEVNVTRYDAKQLNFSILYGRGIEALAKALSISLQAAKVLKKRFFLQLPGVDRFIRGVRTKGEKDLGIFSWFGRRLRVAEKKWAYRLVNHLIQGGCADVVKIAMVQVNNLLIGKKSRMMLQIHDEIVLEIANDEEHLIPEIVKIMENVYPPKNGLPLTASAMISKKSLSKKDAEEWKTK